jgi:hypothetical protein
METPIGSNRLLPTSHKQLMIHPLRYLFDPRTDPRGMTRGVLSMDEAGVYRKGCCLTADYASMGMK